MAIQTTAAMSPGDIASLVSAFVAVAAAAGSLFGYLQAHGESGGGSASRHCNEGCGGCGRCREAFCRRCREVGCRAGGAEHVGVGADIGRGGAHGNSSMFAT